MASYASTGSLSVVVAKVESGNLEDSSEELFVDSSTPISQPVALWFCSPARMTLKSSMGPLD